MKCFVGIDLGSTTTKAVVMDENGVALGHGITNSRSNYDTASKVAKMEAFISARLTLFRRALGDIPELERTIDDLLDHLERNFRLELFLEQLGDLRETCLGITREPGYVGGREQLGGAMEEIFGRLEQSLKRLFGPGVQRKSDFFRDLAGAEYMQVAEAVSVETGISFDHLLHIYESRSSTSRTDRPAPTWTASSCRRLIG